jgi:hypothetical protein
MSTNKKCRPDIDCGCDKALVTPTSQPPLEPCDDYQPCSSYTDFKCLVYTGENLVCNGTIYAETGQDLESILTNLVNRVCDLQNQLNSVIP